MTVLVPTLIAGIGKTALDTVDEVAAFLSAVYGADALVNTALVGFDFATLPETLHPSVRYYRITPDVGSMLANSSLREMPDVSTWFDTRYYEADYGNPEVDLTERQLARLAFYGHMQSHKQDFAYFVESAVRQVNDRRQERDSAKVLTHVFVDLEDESAAALVLDIVNALYRGFTDHSRSNPSILLHVALPAALSESRPVAGRVMEKSFAVLREVERFMTAFGSAYHRVYTEDSPLAEFGANTSRLIDIVFLYPYQSGVPVSTRWTDYVMALSDPFETHFGASYMQHNLVNWAANKEKPRQDSIADRYALVTGTYGTRSVIFPVAQLRRYWSDKLSHAVLDTCLGRRLSRRKVPEYLRQEWINRRDRETDSGMISCPSMVDWLMDTPTIEEFSALDVASWFDRLFDRDADNAKIQSMRQESTGILDWQPSLDDVTSTTPDMFTAEVEQMLRQRFGLLQHSPEQMDNPFTDALSDLLAVQRERFFTSLNYFILRQLNTPGVGLRGIEQLVSDAVYRPLATSAANVRGAYLQLRRDDRMDDLTTRLQRFGRRVRRIKTIFGGYGDDAAHYMQQIEEMSGQLRRYLLLYRIVDFLDDLTTGVKALSTHLGIWLQALAAENDSVLTYLADSVVRPVLRSSENRLWLDDEDWQTRMFEVLRETVLSSLQERLQWVAEAGADGAQRVVFMADGHALALEPEAHRQDADFLRGLASAVVGDMPLDIWDQYLSDDAIRRVVLPEIQRFLAGGNVNWRSHATTDENALLLPASIFDKQKQKSHLLDALSEYDLKLQDIEVFLNVDDTRLTRFNAVEGILWRETAEYKRAAAAYADMPSSERKRLHVFRPEIATIDLEERARFVLDEQFVFSSAIVPLLDRPTQIRQFVQLAALGLIDVFSYDGSNEDYAFRRIDAYWWLALPPDRPSLNRALEIFCTYREALPYGKPYDRAGSRSSLPYASLDNDIDEEIAQRVTRRMESSDPLPKTDYWRRVDTIRSRSGKNSRTTRQAYHDATILTAIESYQLRLQDMQGEYDMPSREERETRILLILTAEEIRNEYRDRLNRLMKR